jgi:hypothetical protein
VALAVGPALVQLVDRLQRENLFLAGQVGFLQAKLQTAEDTIRLLQAPDDAPEDPPAPDPAGEPPADLEAASAPTAAASGASDEAPGWWRRALAWLRG